MRKCKIKKSTKFKKALKKKKIIEKISLSEEDKKNLQQAALATWQTIGYDVLRCEADDKEIPIERALVSRRVVLDGICDNIEEYFGSGAINYKVSDTLLKFLKTASYNDIVKIIGPVFPYSRYGL